MCVFKVQVFFPQTSQGSAPTQAQPNGFAVSITILAVVASRLCYQKMRKYADCIKTFSSCFRSKMVQKYQSPVRVYKYSFEMVMAVSTIQMRCMWLVYIRDTCLYNVLYCLHVGERYLKCFFTIQIKTI